MFLTPAARVADHVARGWWGDMTVDGLFQDRAATGGNALALIDPRNRTALDGQPPERLTWAQLRDRVEACAAGLLSHGLRKDDVLLVQLPNTVDAIILLLAASRLGLIISPVVMQYRAHELGHIIARTNPRAYVTVASFAGHDHLAMARQLCPDVPVLTPRQAVGDPAIVAPHIAASPVNAAEVLTICWTSGTESRPKGVPRDHNHWILNARVVAEACGMRPGDTLLNPFPLVNIGSIGGLVLPWLHIGGRLVLHHPFDLALFLEQIGTERVTYTIAPPAILTALLQQPQILGAADITSLRAIGSGSAPLSPFLISGWQEKRIEICNIFGANEGTSLFASADDVPDPVDRARFYPRHAAGTNWPGFTASVVETRLVDPATETEITAADTPGELRIAGGNIFSGYWNDPDLNSRAFDDKGFFRTGDLFEIGGRDNRFFRFVGRSKELIMRGGVNISPAELDDLLIGHPAIVEAATVGIPDPVLGERIAVAVVPRGEAPTIADLAAWLDTRGTAIFKRPERLVVVDRLPRNAMNKVVRADLRAVVLDKLGL
jgi:acyl-CoA synthetase (AMP-forming)/AMP-acid ligase II